MTATTFLWEPNDFWDGLVWFDYFGSVMQSSIMVPASDVDAALMRADGAVLDLDLAAAWEELLREPVVFVEREKPPRGTDEQSDKQPIVDVRAG